MSDLKYAHDFIDYVNASPTPYHAVASVKKILTAAGFSELSERDQWSASTLSKGGKYFVTRNGLSLIGFTVGGQFENGNGIAIVGAHTDSPCLRIKPVLSRTKEGFIQVGVEQYGGLIAHLWFDRDLLIAGRVYVRENDAYVPKLLKIDRPLLRIPTLAIHLDRGVNTKFEFNKEEKLLPIAGQVAHDTTDACCPGEKLSDTEFELVQNVVGRHSSALIAVIAQELGVETSAIEDFELVLFDHQKLTIGGLHNEFIFSPRLDNLTLCYTAATALTETDVDSSKGINLISLFDHEEIGSVLAQGADSSFLPDVLTRLTRVDFGGGSGDYFHQTMAKSFLLSLDMAHGVHPNYTGSYESNHRPELNKGPVIKINANQRYATNSPGIVLLKKAADRAQVPLQLFVVRNDLLCGSTIGPMLSAKLGVRTLDLGNPQLSMHLIRETGGTFDIEKLTKLFASFFTHYVELDASIKCDHL